jgi:hypothetical protein
VLQEAIESCLVNETEPVGEEQMCLDLREGTISDGEMVKKLPRTSPPLTFGDVCHD